MLAGLILAGFLGINVAKENYSLIAFVAIGICVLAWAIAGRRVWWLPIFFFASLGGVFYPGFKIYAHEMAVLVCLLPLSVTLAMKRDSFKDRGFRIPTSAIILLFYLCIHYLFSIVLNKLEGGGGFGNISRRYMDAIWPLLIFLPFLAFGNTKYIPWVLHLIAGATLIRFAIGMYSAFRGYSDTILFIPGINFAPAGGFGENDLRTSGSSLVCVAICYFCIYRSFLVRILMVLLTLLAVWGTLLGGGRITILLLLGLFGFAILIYRNYALIFLWLSALSIGIIFLNANPEAIQHLPDQVMRSASAFLFDRNLAADSAETTASDEWHARLMTEGIKSWLADFGTIFVGRGVGKFEESAWNSLDPDAMLAMAIQTSRFEAFFWNTLATFGLVGFVLYLVLMFKIVSTLVPILYREKISSPVHAIMFIATFRCIFLLLLGWISGGFPSFEILLGIVALVAAHDMKHTGAPADSSAVCSQPKSLSPLYGSSFR